MQEPGGRLCHRLQVVDSCSVRGCLHDLCETKGPLARQDFGTGNKFIVPMIAHGKVYVGTTDGVGVFGLLPAATHSSK
jgi:hypothetical protein